MQLHTFLQQLKNNSLDIFTLNDAIKITEQKKEIVKNKLNKYVKEKKIYRIKKGIYSYNEIENKFQLQQAYKNTYISLQSALEYYESSTQRYNNLDLITKKTLNKQNIINTTIKFHKIKKELFFGFEKKDVEKTSIHIANKEKTIIDCIYFSNIVYLTDTNEFIKKYAKELDKEKISTYLKKINSSTLNKRVGFLLEKNNIELNELLINNKYEKLNKNLQAKGEKNKKWKLIINEEISLWNE
jgi:predicted transcriptional regulator of viral defense system